MDVKSTKVKGAVEGLSCFRTSGRWPVVGAGVERGSPGSQSVFGAASHHGWNSVRQYLSESGCPCGF